MTGCGVGSEALGSPICAQETMPPLMIILGFAAKEWMGHSTMSASLPFSIEPT
ncbi:hypothetical protein SGRI78S_01933 [Streptomyces griseus subsp. griseus]